MRVEWEKKTGPNQVPKWWMETKEKMDEWKILKEKKQRKIAKKKHWKQTRIIMTSVMIIIIIVVPMNDWWKYRLFFNVCVCVLKLFILFCCFFGKILVFLLFFLLFFNCCCCCCCLPEFDFAKKFPKIIFNTFGVTKMKKFWKKFFDSIWSMCFEFYLTFLKIDWLIWIELVKLEILCCHQYIPLSLCVSSNVKVSGFFFCSVRWTINSNILTIELKWHGWMKCNTMEKSEKIRKKNRNRNKKQAEKMSFSFQIITRNNNRNKIWIYDPVKAKKNKNRFSPTQKKEEEKKQKKNSSRSLTDYCYPVYLIEMKTI